VLAGERESENVNQVGVNQVAHQTVTPRAHLMETASLNFASCAALMDSSPTAISLNSNRASSKHRWGEGEGIDGVRRESLFHTLSHTHTLSLSPFLPSASKGREGWR
jgi:hypothetical protein